MKIVVALGGNALQASKTDKSADAQLKTCKETAKSIVDLVAGGHDVAIVHGNGPQVGEIVKVVEAAHKADDTSVIFPFDVCGAFSQGYIGYHLQNAIGEELRRRGINRETATIVTEVLVDKNDNGFQNPTKPIGSFYTEEKAKLLEKECGYVMKEDAGRGYRRVVASPKPIDIIEKNVISDMFNRGVITISCGGGGIPVIKEGEEINGVSAVIDKDFAAEKLAEILDADILLILTAVEKVCINFNKPNQESLDIMTLEDINKYIKEGQFAAGSMLPKVEACKKFVEFNDDKTAIIASLANAKDVLNGESGTRVVK